MRRDDHPGVLLVLVVAVLVLGFTSAYSAWVSSTNHHASCARSDLILDTVHNLVVLFFTPPQGQTLTAAQLKTFTSLESQAFGLIDQARC